MALPPIVALEIGTSKVVALVGEMHDGTVRITGMGEQRSTGVRKGEITDVENAVVTVRAVLERAEETSDVSIRGVQLVVSGGHLQSLVNRGSIAISDKGGEIHSEDVEQVMEVARAVSLPADRETLHTICQHFSVDGQERVIKPEGMEGARLSLDMLVLHGVRSRMHNAVRVASAVPVDVQDVAFGGLCSALSVLTTEQKQSGVIVIDCGGGTTDYLVYAENVVATAGSIGVGGDHITNDIALCFTIPQGRADILKKKSGSAVVDRDEADKMVTLPPEVGFPGRNVSMRALHTVMNARVDEIFRLVKKRLMDEGLLFQIGGGVVLTGGCARMRGFTDAARQVFGLPCVVGYPRNVSGIATAIEGPEYAACCGLIQYGYKTMGAQRGVPPFGGWLRKFFGG